MPAAQAGQAAAAFVQPTKPEPEPEQLLLYFPGAQVSAVHAVSWLLLLYCPGAQDVHEVRGVVPLEFTTEPAAHVMHAESVFVAGA